MTDKIIVGLAFGDEGKGSIVDYFAYRGRLAHPAQWVIRFNGGPQAAHNVVTPDGKIHRFSQFASGMFHPHVHTYLSRYVIIDPIAILKEGEELKQKGIPHPFERLAVDAKCLILTPYHGAINQIREILRGENRHGSCGIGVAQAYIEGLNENLPNLFAEDLLAKNRETLSKKIRLQRLMKLDLAEQLLSQAGYSRNPGPSSHSVYSGINADQQTDTLENSEENSDKQLIQNAIALLRNAESEVYLANSYQAFVNCGAQILGGNESRFIFQSKHELLFEGAQGVLLDMDLGFFPHVTPSNTTFANAISLLEEYNRKTDVERVGVIRPYLTRHGHGPFPTEDPALGSVLPELHNQEGFAGSFRFGWMDLVLFRHSLFSCEQVDTLCITNLDRIALVKQLYFCNDYRFDPATESPINDLNVWGKSIGHVSGGKNREHQERITKMLFRAKPNLYETTPNEIIERLTILSGCRTILKSDGPAFLNKTISRV